MPRYRTKGRFLARTGDVYVSNESVLGQIENGTLESLRIGYSAEKEKPPGVMPRGLFLLGRKEKARRSGPAVIAS